MSIRNSVRTCALACLAISVALATETQAGKEPSSETSFRRIVRSNGGESLEVLASKDAFLQVKPQGPLALTPLERWCTALQPCVVDLPPPLLAEPIPLLAILRKGRGSQSPELGRYTFVIRSTQDTVSASGHGFWDFLTPVQQWLAIALLCMMFLPCFIVLLALSVRVFRYGTRLLFLPMVMTMSSASASRTFGMEDCTALRSNLHEWKSCDSAGLNCSDAFVSTVELPVDAPVCFHVKGEGTDLYRSEGSLTKFESEILYYTPTDVYVERFLIQGHAFEHSEVNGFSISQGECATLTFDGVLRKWESSVEEDPEKKSLDDRMKEMMESNANEYGYEFPRDFVSHGDLSLGNYGDTTNGCTFLPKCEHVAHAREGEYHIGGGRDFFDNSVMIDLTVVCFAGMMKVEKVKPSSFMHIYDHVFLSETCSHGCDLPPERHMQAEGTQAGRLTYTSQAVPQSERIVGTDLVTGVVTEAILPLPGHSRGAWGLGALQISPQSWDQRVFKIYEGRVKPAVFGSHKKDQFAFFPPSNNVVVRQESKVIPSCLKEPNPGQLDSQLGNLKEQPGFCHHAKTTSLGHFYNRDFMSRSISYEMPRPFVEESSLCDCTAKTATISGEFGVGSRAVVDLEVKSDRTCAVILTLGGSSYGLTLSQSKDWTHYSRVIHLANQPNVTQTLLSCSADALSVKTTLKESEGGAYFTSEADVHQVQEMSWKTSHQSDSFFDSLGDAFASVGSAIGSVTSSIGSMFSGDWLRDILFVLLIVAGVFAALYLMQMWWSRRTVVRIESDDVESGVLRKRGRRRRADI